MKKLTQYAGALPFFLAVFMNAFVDLGHKIVIQNTVFKLYDGSTQVILTAIVNSLILLPFIFLINPAGFLSDKYRKTSVMRMAAWAALGICCLITLSYYQGWFEFAFALTFLLAAQSALYSPAKLGFVKEFFGKERLGEANGVVSALSIVAILTGIFAFSILFEMWFPASGSLSEAVVLQSIAPIGWILMASALFEVILMYKIPQSQNAMPEKTFDWQKFGRGKLFLEDMSPLARNRIIRLSVIGLATFWAVGQVLLAAFPSHAKESLALTDTVWVQGILACTGLGIAIGSMISGKVSRNHIETGLLPIGALGIALGLMVLTFLESPVLVAMDFLFIGIMGGMFIVPLNALIQFNAEEHELGRVLAANNWVQNVNMFCFLVITVGFAAVGWSSASLLQLIAAVAVIGCFYTVYTLPQSLVRFILAIGISRIFKINVQGLKNMPSKGGVLLLGNHVSWVDWAIVQIASPRPVHFVMAQAIYSKWYLKWFFDMFGCIPISQGAKSKKALEEVAKLLDSGEVVCLFPEGTISRTGHFAEFRKGYERACGLLETDVPIVPFYLRGLWGSQFSRASDELKKAAPESAQREILIAFGKAISKDTVAADLKQVIFDLSVSSWQEYIDSLDTIDRLWIDRVKQPQKNVSSKFVLADAQGTKLTSTQALVGAIALSQKIKKGSREQNIGLLLPSSVGGMLANMAVLMAGRTSVNLNYTAGLDGLNSAIEQANIHTVYTSRLFLKKLSAKGIDLQALADGDEQSQGVKLIFLEDVMGSIPQWQKLLLLATCKVLPGNVLKRFYASKKKPDDRACILFSSGSEGKAKGVCLSHKNIVANVKQIAEVLNVESKDRFLANLPLFHAFGLTATQFLPLLEGIPVVCQPDPTDIQGAAKAIAKFQVSILFGTSTFLRMYASNKRVNPLMLDSIRLVVAGAERLQDSVRTAFKLKFNKEIYEGYGATETTPVASVNLPDRLSPGDWKVQVGQRLGSVGMPLPGTSVQIVDPETFCVLPVGSSGMILIGGGQVMEGYLDRPELTEKVIHEKDGVRWYVTGDKGRLDEDGFLFIEDRYSRFAKVAGEMVSLGKLESALYEVFTDQNSDDELEIVATNIADEKKGEQIVVLSNKDLDSETLRAGLLERGLPNLAIPSRIYVVDSVPKLGSGKTDFSASKKIALDLTAA